MADPVESLRGKPGEPFKPSSAGFNLLADTAANFRLGKLGDAGDRPQSTDAPSQLVARAVNMTGTVYYAGQVCKIGATTGSHYPAAWRAQDPVTLQYRHLELNEEPLLQALEWDSSTNPDSPFGVFVEPCLPGMIARVCLAGFCVVSVQTTTGLDGSQYRRVSPGAPHAPGLLRNFFPDPDGSCRVVQVFPDSSAGFPGNEAGTHVWALVELGRRERQKLPYPVQATRFSVSNSTGGTGVLIRVPPLSYVWGFFTVHLEVRSDVGPFDAYGFRVKCEWLDTPGQPADPFLGADLDVGAQWQGSPASLMTEHVSRIANWPNATGGTRMGIFVVQPDISRNAPGPGNPVLGVASVVGWAGMAYQSPFNDLL